LSSEELSEDFSEEFSSEQSDTVSAEQSEDESEEPSVSSAEPSEEPSKELSEETPSGPQTDSLGITYTVVGQGFCTVTAFTNKTGVTELTIPKTAPNGEKVTAIGENAFEGQRLKTVIIPDTVKTISNKAFYKVSGLASVTIPGSVVVIGDYAFSQCTFLDNVTIPKSVTFIGKYAFQGCESLSNVYVRASISRIPEGMFMGCPLFGEVELPKVTAIGKYAFSHAYWSLRGTYEVPDGVKIIEVYAYEEVTFSGIILPASITELKNNSFIYSPEFKGIIINVQYRGKEAQWDKVIKSGSWCKYKGMEVYCLDSGDTPYEQWSEESSEEPSDNSSEDVSEEPTDLTVYSQYGKTFADKRPIR
jgi:hypothetical protein